MIRLLFRLQNFLALVQPSKYKPIDLIISKRICAIKRNSCNIENDNSTKYIEKLLLNTLPRNSCNLLQQNDSKAVE